MVCQLDTCLNKLPCEYIKMKLLYSPHTQTKERFAMKNIITFIVAALTLTSCAGNPISVEPVEGFEADRYLGKWYEVARLDHSFERGMSNVTANYSQNDDGTISVLNRGFKQQKGKYTVAKGKAKFAVDNKIGHLKVSFFGPFYGDYILFDLDKVGYEYAFVSGGKDNYLWLLSRTPTISDALRQDFIAKSTALGYNTENLIWVEQNEVESPQ